MNRRVGRVLFMTLEHETFHTEVCNYGGLGQTILIAF